MKRLPVSVLIPCYNSAEVIEDCLKSVAWADEIFVCDSFSTDDTIDICRRYTDRIVQHEYVNSATQKNWAIPQVRHEWVFIVDTDERVSAELRREIEITLTADCPFDGFRIPRLNHVFGRPLCHGGFYPDYQLRLFRRDRGRYESRQVHAHVVLDGRCGTLDSPLLHFGQRDVDQITRTYLLRYTGWEAAQKDSEGVRFKPSDLLIRPLGAFAVRYVGKRGFLDGAAGLFMALTVSAYVFLTYARLWQLQSARGWDASGSDRAGRRPDLEPRGPLRVGFIVPHDKVGGAEILLRTFLGHCERAAIDPVVFTSEEGPLSALVAEAGSRVTFVPTPRFFSTSLRLGSRTVFNPPAVAADCILLAWSALAYARALRRARIEVALTGNIFAHLLGAMAAPLARAELVWYVQDLVSPRLGAGTVLPFFARLGARRAAAVICNSEAVAGSLRAHWPAAVPADRLRVVYPGIETARFDPEAPGSIRSKLGIADDVFVVAHVGRLVPWKGQRELLRAARLVVRERPDARFIVVGDTAFEGPDFRRELLDLIHALNLEGYVIFTGWRSDIPAVLSGSDVLVHSSVSPEPFGLVVAEAMALARPVIASALGGTRELVRDGIDGLVVDPRDPRHIAAAILQLAGNPDQRRAMGRAGRDRVLAHFSAETFARRLSRAIIEAAPPRSARRPAGG